MIDYTEIKCPVCDEAFSENDEIVVCPDCGLPHHKSCYLSVGHCAMQDAHGTDMQWQAPKQTDAVSGLNDNSSNMNETDIGKNRGESVNPNFVIGNFSSDVDDDDDVDKSIYSQALKIDGVEKSDTVFGEKCTDVAIFAGMNASRYIRVFKEMEYRNSKTGWNWLAFLSPQFWLLARKCYKFGAIAMIFSFFSSLMVFFMQGESGYLELLAQKLPQNPSLVFEDPVLISFLILSVISLTFRIIIGIFGDYIYKSHMLSTMKKLHEDKNDSPISIIKAGGVNLIVPVIVYLGVDLLLQIVISFII